MFIHAAGHCSVCHQDYPPNQYHGCGGTTTPCRPTCSTMKAQPAPTIAWYKESVTVEDMIEHLSCAKRK